MAPPEELLGEETRVVPPWEAASQKEQSQPELGAGQVWLAGVWSAVWEPVVEELQCLLLLATLAGRRCVAEGWASWEWELGR